jgi:hypothetical protein
MRCTYFAIPDEFESIRGRPCDARCAMDGSNNRQDIDMLRRMVVTAESGAWRTFLGGCLRDGEGAGSVGWEEAGGSGGGGRLLAEGVAHKKSN